MANHKSAAKRAKQTIKKTAVNRARESDVKTIVKKVRDAVTKKDKALATKLFTEAQSKMRRLAKSGVIKKETASRRTGRLAAQVAKI